MKKILVSVIAIFILFFIANQSIAQMKSATGSSFLVIKPGDSPELIVKQVANVVPSEKQMKWQEREFIAFAHFGMNTFTNKEWGEGKESPDLFNPTAFDHDNGRKC